MPKIEYWNLLENELKRIDSTSTEKRNELVIEGYATDGRAIVAGKHYLIFNSNDYLGLRFHPEIGKAHDETAKTFGNGPGGVRFICGTMKIHKELEKALAKFHGREDAMIFSSAFAANLAVLHCIIKGQAKTSLVNADALVISDEYNHRSIIDGIRVAGLPKENKLVFKHKQLNELDKLLLENKGKFSRVLVVTDGIFSMLGVYQDVKQLQEICNKHDAGYKEGIITVVDDSHGVASFGQGGRGVEGKCNTHSDVLLATMGKGFGVDGGYIVGKKIMIDYLRESAATYIYSNPISPGAAGACLKSIQIVDRPEGRKLIQQLNDNIKYFKKEMLNIGFKFNADSEHAVQPVLVGEPGKCRALTRKLFELGIVVTNISYPVVPQGMDEIRVQLSARHTKEQIDECVEAFEKAGKEVCLIK